MSVRLLDDDPHDRALRDRVRPAGWVNPTPKGRYHLVVVGAGTAGLVCAAGAAGLLAGLLGVPYVGAAAAIGRGLFFIGAIVVHLRARGLLKIVYPGCFLALAVACLAVAANAS